MNFKKYKNIIFVLLFIGFTTYVIYWALADEKTEVSEEVKIKEITKKESKPKKNIENNINKKVNIDIKGEVVNPGVYELTDENNVNDAINLAGGLTQKSDTSNINLSKKLNDEMVIIVYSKEEIKKMKEAPETVCPPCNDACIEEKDEKSKLTEQGEKNENLKVNINTALKEELLTLNGIGESKAEAIIEYRNKNGYFSNIEEIKNVSGIGEGAYEKIKDNITV